MGGGGFLSLSSHANDRSSENERTDAWAYLYAHRQTDASAYVCLGVFILMTFGVNLFSYSDIGINLYLAT